MNNDIVSPWTDKNLARWQRIAQHPFEDASAPLDFCAKLAREQGWSRAQAQAAIREYQRFCFLATVVKGDVVPSAAVDEVWHLHLTYTQDYWEHFCPHALGHIFHHQPGGQVRGDKTRYREGYAETLSEYERWFGAPPEQWWPGTAERFRAPARQCRVDRDRAWIIPKPRLPMFTRAALAASVCAAIGLLATTMAQASTLNPLDWSGPAFLMLFLGLALASIVTAVVVRRMQNDSGRGDSVHGLDATSVAYLAGGEARVIDRVVGELLARKVAEFNPTTGVLQVNDVPNDLDAPAHEIATALRRDGHLGVLRGRFGNTLEEIRKGLEQRGLLLDGASASAIARSSAMAPALVFALGIVKVAVGIARDRPVAILVVCCILLAIVTLVFAFKRPTHSRSGQRVLAELRRRNARVMRAPKANEWPMALALAGTAVMTGTAFAAFHDYRQPQTGSTGDGSSSSTSSSDSSSSSDSGSSDSGGSSGCGGCGGGGGD